MPVGIENLATSFLQGLNARKQQGVKMLSINERLNALICKNSSLQSAGC